MAAAFLLLAFGPPLGGLAKEIVEVVAHEKVLGLDYGPCRGVELGPVVLVPAMLCRISVSAVMFLSL